jgi:hypothetical protein
MSSRVGFSKPIMNFVAMYTLEYTKSRRYSQRPLRPFHVRSPCWIAKLSVFCARLDSCRGM